MSCFIINTSVRLELLNHWKQPHNQLVRVHHSVYCTLNQLIRTLLHKLSNWKYHRKIKLTVSIFKDLIPQESCEEKNTKLKIKKGQIVQYIRDIKRLWNVSISKSELYNISTRVHQYLVDVFSNIIKISANILQMKKLSTLNPYIITQAWLCVFPNNHEFLNINDREENFEKYNHFNTQVKPIQKTKNKTKNYTPMYKQGIYTYKLSSVEEEDSQSDKAKTKVSISPVYENKGLPL